MDACSVSVTDVTSCSLTSLLPVSLLGGSEPLHLLLRRLGHELFIVQDPTLLSIGRITILVQGGVILRPHEGVCAAVHGVHDGVGEGGLVLLAAARAVGVVAAVHQRAAQRGRGREELLGVLGGGGRGQGEEEAIGKTAQVSELRPLKDGEARREKEKNSQ